MIKMSFTGKRYGCCLQNPCDKPQPIGNLVQFDLTGFFYRTIPEWAESSGRRLIPLQFSVNDNEFYYSWSFYKPYKTPLCNTHWFLSTSDDIVPVINETITGTRMKVERLSRYNGYTLWKVSC